MDWQKQADEWIKEHAIEGAFLPAARIREVLVGGGVEPVIADSTIADYVAHVHERLQIGRRNCAEVLAFPARLRGWLEQLKMMSPSAGAKTLGKLAEAIDYELGRARYVEHYIGAILESSAALREEYDAQGYDSELWNGLKKDHATLPETIGGLTAVLNAIRAGAPQLWR
jgi:hypothetical protein